jgi:uncharacterized integral membrane protein
MLPLGLLLVIAAGAVGIAVAMHNTDPTTVAAFGQSWDMTLLGVFLIGAVVGIVGMTGFALMIAGLLGRRDRRTADRERLAGENARLRAQISEAAPDGQATDPYPADTKVRSGKHSFRG